MTRVLQPKSAPHTPDAGAASPNGAHAPAAAAKKIRRSKFELVDEGPAPALGAAAPAIKNGDLAIASAYGVGEKPKKPRTAKPSADRGEPAPSKMDAESAGVQATKAKKPRAAAPPRTLEPTSPLAAAAAAPAPTRKRARSIDANAERREFIATVIKGGVQARAAAKPDAHEAKKAKTAVAPAQPAKDTQAAQDAAAATAADAVEKTRAMRLIRRRSAFIDSIAAQDETLRDAAVLSRLGAEAPDVSEDFAYNFIRRVLDGAHIEFADTDDLGGAVAASTALVTLTLLAAANSKHYFAVVAVLSALPTSTIDALVSFLPSSRAAKEAAAKQGKWNVSCTDVSLAQWAAAVQVLAHTREVLSKASANHAAVREVTKGVHAQPTVTRARVLEKLAALLPLEKQQAVATGIVAAINACKEQLTPKMCAPAATEVYATWLARVMNQQPIDASFLVARMCSDMPLGAWSDLGAACGALETTLTNATRAVSFGIAASAFAVMSGKMSAA